MALTTGTRIGAYEVLAALGSGGMGDVYRARDTKLGRDVALKVVSDTFARDPKRLALLEREARTLASLNHPNIAQVYGFENPPDGGHHLVMELVDGEDLSTRIARGAIPLDQSLSVARQVADAIAGAHEIGIVHRDLKPANIRITPGGVVKVLDFGLAKTIDGDDSRAYASQALTGEVLSSDGFVIGTAPYMSPEQARGLAIDRRTDVWAFGCVLFEMLTGVRAFSGKTTTDVLAGVLHAEPNWDLLPAATSAPIRRVLRRTLVKERTARLGDLSSVRFDLDDALHEREPPPASPAGSHRQATLTIAAALIIGAALGYLGRPAPTPSARAQHFSIVPPDGISFATIDVGAALALSPDGRRVAYVAEGATGRLLWVQSIDAFDARPLAGTDGGYGPFWSPDGRWIGFLADATLKKVSIDGGQPQPLTPAAPSISATTGSWHRDGTILFTQGGMPLRTVSDRGGDSQAITSRDLTRFEENHYHPAFLPDGRHYLVLVRGGVDLRLQLALGDVGSNDRRVLLSDVTNAQYAPPMNGDSGWLLFVREGALLAQAFDIDRLSLTGPPAVIAQNVAMNGMGSLGDFSVSPDGVLAYRQLPRNGPELVWYDRAGRQIGQFGDRVGNARDSVRLSPDGKLAAFSRQAGGTSDIWIANLGSNDISRFTLNGGRTPVWSPDGASIAFLRGDTIYRKAVLGSGDEIVLWKGPDILSLNDWSGDNRYLLVTRWDTSQPELSGRAVWLVPQSQDGATSAPVRIDRGIHPQFVPNVGAPRWIAYDDDGQSNVSAMPGTTPGKWQVSTTVGNGTRWRRDGREAFIGTGAYSPLMLVDADPTVPAFKRGAIRPLFKMPRSIATATSQYGLGYDVSADGQRFVSISSADERPSPAIHIVTNWRTLLAR